jgi:hypothetical protein
MHNLIRLQRLVPVVCALLLIGCGQQELLTDELVRKMESECWRESVASANDDGRTEAALENLQLDDVWRAMQLFADCKAKAEAVATGPAP